MPKWHVEITNTRYPKTYCPPLAEEIVITYKRKDNPGKIEFEVINRGDLDFQPGNPVVLFCDGKPVFKGYIFKKSRTSVRRIRCVAYDQLRYLKYKSTIQYEDKSADELVKMIADDRGLLVGTLSPTSTKISRLEEDSEYYAMIMHAIEATLVETGQLYVLYDDAGKLTLKDVKNMTFTKFIFDENVMGPWDYDVSIDDGSYNIIDITVKDEQRGEAQKIHWADTEKVKEWGMLQFHAVTNDDFASVADRAKKLLPLVSRPVRTLKLKDCKGDLEVRGGSLIVVNLALGDMNAYAWFMVESVIHKIKGDKHTMDIDVINENFMPAIDISGAFPNKKETKETSTEGDMVPEDSNAAKAWNILRRNGYSAAATAGILGSLQAESGLNPTILQNGVGPGTGIAQWENPGRWPNLVTWAKNSAKNPWTIEAQVGFLIYELEGGETTTFSILSNRYGGLTKFKNATDVRWAVDAFYWSFERGSIHRMDVRYAAAQKFYNQWKDYKEVKAMAGGKVGDGKFPPYNYVTDPDNRGCIRHCTWYMYNRYRQLTGKSISLKMGDGGEWASYARSYGMSVNTGRPFPGAAMCQQGNSNPYAPGGTGHISFVEKVNKDGSVVCTAMWSGDGVLHVENHPAHEVTRHQFIDVMSWLKANR